MKQGEKTRIKILEAACSIWPVTNLAKIAEAAGLKSHRSVSYYFATEELKDLVAEYAVNSGNSRVIVQLLAMDHIAIKSLSALERKKHLNKIHKS